MSREWQLRQSGPSTSGGNSPRWRRDSQELFYRSAQNAIVSVVPRLPGEWSDTNSAELFHTPPNTTRYAVSPDGHSFLFIEGTQGAADSLFHAVLGWQ